MGWPDIATLIQRAGQRAFGEHVTYTPDGGAPVSIQGIFSAAGERVEIEGGVAVSSRRPVLSVHLADLAAAPARGDALTVRGTSYVVRDVVDDGEGDADLILGAT